MNCLSKQVILTVAAGALGTGAAASPPAATISPAEVDYATRGERCLKDWACDSQLSPPNHGTAVALLPGSMDSDPLWIVGRPSSIGPDGEPTDAYTGSVAAFAITAGGSTYFTGVWRANAPCFEKKKYTQTSFFGAGLAVVKSVMANTGPDVVVAAPNYDGGSGAIFVIDGQPSTADYEVPDTPVVVGSAGAGLGMAIATIGDTDNNGDSEIVVAEDVDEGTVHVYELSPAATLLKTITVNDDQTFGAAVAGGWDLDGDAKADFAVYRRGDSKEEAWRAEIRVYSGETMFDKEPAMQLEPCIAENCNESKPPKEACWRGDKTTFSSIEEGLTLGDTDGNGIGEVIFVGYDCPEKGPAALRVFALEYNGVDEWVPVMISDPIVGGLAGGDSMPWINDWPLAAGDVMGNTADEVFVNLSANATEDPAVLIIWNSASAGGPPTGVIVGEMTGPITGDPLGQQGAFGWAIAAANVAGSSQAEVVVGAPLFGSYPTGTPCKDPKIATTGWGHAYLYLDLDIQDWLCDMADWNGVNGVNSTDVSDFVNDYLADLATCTPLPCDSFVTDIDGNGVVNMADALLFDAIWESCPSLSP